MDRLLGYVFKAGEGRPEKEKAGSTAGFFCAMFERVTLWPEISTKGWGNVPGCL
jgi:hypothetical protein